eukprot:1156369-Pelagomonas_calceolata.AAC.1
MLGTKGTTSGVHLAETNGTRKAYMWCLICRSTSLSFIHLAPSTFSSNALHILTGPLGFSAAQSKARCFCFPHHRHLSSTQCPPPVQHLLRLPQPYCRTWLCMVNDMANKYPNLAGKPACNRCKCSLLASFCGLEEDWPKAPQLPFAGIQCGMLDAPTKDLLKRKQCFSILCFPGSTCCKAFLQPGKRGAASFFAATQPTPFCFSSMLSKCPSINQRVLEPRALPHLPCKKRERVSSHCVGSNGSGGSLWEGPLGSHRHGHHMLHVVAPNNNGQMGQRTTASYLCGLAVSSCMGRIRAIDGRQVIKACDHYDRFTSHRNHLNS